MSWRALLLVIAKQFQQLVNPTNKVNDKSAFFLGDTTHAKTGRIIEQVSVVFSIIPTLRNFTISFLILGFPILVRWVSWAIHTIFANSISIYYLPPCVANVVFKTDCKRLTSADITRFHRCTTRSSHFHPISSLKFLSYAKSQKSQETVSLVKDNLKKEPWNIEKMIPKLNGNHFL